jgi:N-acetylglucosaminyldiphosphoundecaprenol N-acetyl-beta-D-mannosaminyltransferase
MTVNSLESYKVLGVNVSAVQISDVIRQMDEWIEERSYGHFIAVTNTHVITESWFNPGYKRILNSADYVVPDGMPLVWLGRIDGYSLKRRVYGPELMERFLLDEKGRKRRHFLYGGKPGVPERLIKNLTLSCPELSFVGSYSPPFRPLTPEEDKTVIDMVNDLGPDVVWVGLGAPKQEMWMHEHRHRLHVPLMVGVGAAFITEGKRFRMAMALD